MDRRQAAVARARREIVEAAGAQFAAYGYEATSFSRVAEAMGRPKSAIGYHLFASKEALANAVVDEQERRWLRIAAALDGPGALPELVVFLLTAAREVEVRPVAAGAVRLRQEMPRLGLAIAPRFDVEDFVHRRLRTELVMQGVPEPEPDLDAAVDVLLGATLGVLAMGSTRAPRDDAADRLRRLWVPLLAHLGLEGVEAVVRDARPLELDLEVVDPAPAASRTGWGPVLA
ncbi:TetR/AcrR family transcriptional regulator [Clavibacter michiganensis]|uniref:TetR/AcrR family transcriptional regulator n=1 Tax=Clavibacter michiganensis TaxID=28447 RepID=A0A2S5VWX5_9MICO|nr:TetR/AcrR family transcriptional regulator [Clavibacter michiganensis]PPF70076.1 TetR/AcrR family transcriptional regulator [Clavibacter michiganensis]